jgi:DNA-binding transcriptional LysR family regulator
VITTLVASQAGIGILPSRVATKVKEQGLKLFSKEAPKYSDKICLIYRADLQRSKASRSIASFIEKKLTIKEN